MDAIAFKSKLVNDIKLMGFGDFEISNFREFEIDLTIVEGKDMNKKVIYSERISVTNEIFKNKRDGIFDVLFTQPVIIKPAT